MSLEAARQTPGISTQGLACVALGLRIARTQDGCPRCLGVYAPGETDGHTLASMALPLDTEGTQPQGRGPGGLDASCPREVLHVSSGTSDTTPRISPALPVRRAAVKA